MTKTMMIVAALVLGSASGAFAQSYDPDFGTGNIVPTQSADVATQGPLAAHAQVRMSIGGSEFRAVKPFTAGEKALFDRIPKE